jgi:hypothetical protein
MDAALTPRAYTAAAPVAPRADVTPVRAAVPTLLPQPDKSVAASIEHQAARFDGSNARPRARAELLDAAVLREIEREVEFNDETNDLVSRTLNAKTGQVIAQFPAEQILKLRAYVQSEAARVADPEPLMTREA